MKIIVFSVGLLNRRQASMSIDKNKPTTGFKLVFYVGLFYETDDILDLLIIIMFSVGFL